MIERILILLLFTGLCALLCGTLQLCRRVRLRALQRAVDEEAPRHAGVLAALREIVIEGPALLYFTTESCAQCRFQQRPILDRLAAVAPIPVVTLDAIEQEALARHFGILTVPSTVVLDRRRVPVAINHGVALLQTLQAQVGPLLAR